MVTETTQTVEPTVDVDRLAEDLAQLERTVPGTVDRLKRLATRERLEETTAPDEFDKIIHEMMEGWPRHRKMLFGGLCGAGDMSAVSELIKKYGYRDEAGNPILPEDDEQPKGDTLLDKINAVLEERGAAFQADFLLELQDGEALIGKPESTGEQKDDDGFYFETELVNMFANLNDEAKAAVWAYSELMGVGGYTACKITDQIDVVIDAGINVNDAAQRTSWVKGIAGIVSMLNRS